MSNSSENVPVDVTAMQAEAIVRATLNWVKENGASVYDREEWAMMQAAQEYGNKFKGLVGK